MGARAIRILLLVAALAFAAPAAAQYYTWGSDPASLRWHAIRTPDVRIISPDTASATALRTLRYIEAVRPSIGYGFRHGPMRIPFVLHPMNFRSNGLVMWLPKRVEFLTSPAIDGYSMPWVKQLVAHEYRHAVQYNNLNRGVIRAASWLLGQQGATIGLLFMPVWAIEGDAVMSETAMSSYGRALQPRFTIEYRAMGDFAHRRRNPDKWFCGSYRDKVPDHYRLGYQLCAYADTRYGENIWDKVAWYSVRNPYLLFTTPVALRKFYGTGVRRLFRDTFDDLHRFWSSLPRTQDSARPLTPLPEGNYTTYRWPLPLGDTTVLALREDLDRTARFVLLDPRTGGERLLCRTGSLSTRPDAGYGRVWWTEYRRSLLFEQRVDSQLCYLDLADGKPRTEHGVRAALYPTVVAAATLAWVEYAPDGRYAVVVRDDAGERRMPVPVGCELHGLTWEERSQALYVLATDDSGMWLGRMEETGPVALTRGAYVTLSDLRAGQGKLWFGSIASGLDEAHCFDPATGRETRVTESAYGSFAPAPGPQDLYVATCGPRGYAVAVQPRDALQVPVEPSPLPRNRVNPPRRRWDVVNLDTVRFSPADSAALRRAHRVRRYPKVPTLVKFHSWMPVSFDPFALVEEHNVAVNIGATLVSQNLLSNAEGFVSYGWNRRDGSLVRAALRYFGLGVRLDAEGAYGGQREVYALAQVDPETGEVQRQHLPAPGRYYSLGAAASLPLVFQRGCRTRQLTLSASWNFSNGMVANVGQLRVDKENGTIGNIETIGFRTGLHKLTFGAAFSDAVRAAHRDFAPPWAWQFAANYALNPTNGHFSDLVSLYGRVYTPGFFAHNSLTAAATYQTSIGGYKLPSGQRFLSYKSARLIPRGFDPSDIRSNNYLAVSVDYQFPLCYPEGGIPSVLYVKRIRLNAGGDYAQFRTDTGRGTTRLWSWGGDLVFDINLFRQPASATSSVKLSVWKPSGRSVWVGAGFGLPF